MLSEITLDVRPFVAALSRAERGTGFATVVALSRTAKQTAGSLSRLARGVFDRPTPTTLNAFYSQPATRERSVFTVGVKDFAPKGTAAAKYLRAQVAGGGRAQKRSEAALTRAGILRPGEYWVPGPGLKLNAYGNIPGGMIQRILSDLRAASVGDQNRTAQSRKRNSRYRQERFFVPGRGSGLTDGVWRQRGRRRPEPVLLFVADVAYRPRFDFFGKGQLYARTIFPVELRRAVNDGFNQPKGTAIPF